MITLGSHIKHSPVTSISKLAPYSALILSIVLVILFLIRFYILQRFLLEKLHGSKYTQLDDVARRSFLNHYIAGTTKIAILFVGVYPFGAVAFGSAQLFTPYVTGSTVTMGDLLLIAAQMLTGMFIFELIYRVNISPVSVAHHIGSILVAQAAIAINIHRDPESSIEFILCTVWGKQVFHYAVSFLPLHHSHCCATHPPIGAFDILAEFIPHVVLILYRVYPTSHLFLAKLFQVACITTFIGTISETILVMYMFGILWNRWPLSFKIVTPTLHLAFSAAQFHGTMIFYRLWQKQEQQLNMERDTKDSII